MMAWVLQTKARSVANPGFRAPMLLVWLVLLISFVTSAECRVGEAKKPGPLDSLNAVKASTWSLGVCNPSGLPGKSAFLSGVNADVIAVRETHLTSVGRSMLLSGLRSHSRYTHVVSGAPLLRPASTLVMLANTLVLPLYPKFPHALFAPIGHRTFTTQAVSKSQVPLSTMFGLLVWSSMYSHRAKPTTMPFLIT